LPSTQLDRAASGMVVLTMRIVPPERGVCLQGVSAWKVGRDAGVAEPMG
jgi:hypothetical protein